MGPSRQPVRREGRVIAGIRRRGKQNLASEVRRRPLSHFKLENRNSKNFHPDLNSWNLHSPT